MSQAIHCPSCGKDYRFKPELAGRKVKCKCGQVIALPTEAPATDDGGLYDLAPDADSQASTGAARQTVVARAPSADDGDGVPCPSCQSPLAPGSVICVACGFNLKTGAKLQGATGAAGPVKKARAGVSTPAAAGGGTRFAGIPPGLAVKRVADDDKSGIFLKFGIVLAAMLLVVGAVVAMKYVGRDPDAGKPVADEDDAKVRVALKEAFPKEAKAWLAIDESWMMGGWNRRQAESKIDDWYQMGAKQVICFGTRMALWVAIELPDEPEKRAKLFEWQKKWHAEMFERVRTDNGQKYLVIKLRL